MVVISFEGIEAYIYYNNFGHLLGTLMDSKLITADQFISPDNYVVLDHSINTTKGLSNGYPNVVMYYRDGIDDINPYTHFYKYQTNLIGMGNCVVFHDKGPCDDNMLFVFRYIEMLSLEMAEKSINKENREIPQEFITELVNETKKHLNDIVGRFSNGMTDEIKEHIKKNIMNELTQDTRKDLVNSIKQDIYAQFNMKNNLVVLLLTVQFIGFISNTKERLTMLSFLLIFIVVMFAIYRLS